MNEKFTYKGQEFPLLYNHYVERMVLKEISDAKVNGKVYSVFDSEESMVFYSIEAGCEYTDRPFTMIRKVEGEVFTSAITKKDISFMLGFIQDDIDKLISKFMPDKNDDDKPKEGEVIKKKN